MGKTRDVFKKIRNTKGTLYSGSDYTIMIIIQMQMKKAKWLSEEALQRAEKRREAKGK